MPSLATVVLALKGEVRKAQVKLDQLVCLETDR